MYLSISVVLKLNHVCSCLITSFYYYELNRRVICIDLITKQSLNFCTYEDET